MKWYKILLVRMKIYCT